MSNYLIFHFVCLAITFVCVIVSKIYLFKTKKAYNRFKQNLDNYENH